MNPFSQPRGLSRRRARQGQRGLVLLTLLIAILVLPFSVLTLMVIMFFWSLETMVH